MKGIGQYPVGTGEGQDKSENNLGGWEQLIPDYEDGECEAVLDGNKPRISDKLGYLSAVGIIAEDKDGRPIGYMVRQEGFLWPEESNINFVDKATDKTQAILNRGGKILAIATVVPDNIDDEPIKARLNERMSDDVADDDIRIVDYRYKKYGDYTKAPEWAATFALGKDENGNLYFEACQGSELEKIIVGEANPSIPSEGSEVESKEHVVVPTTLNDSGEANKVTEDKSEEKLGHLTANRSKDEEKLERLTADQAKEMWEQALKENSLNGISKYDKVRLLDFVRKCNDDYDAGVVIDKDAKEMFVGNRVLDRLEYEVGWDKYEFEDEIEEYLKNLQRFEAEKGRDPGPSSWESYHERTNRKYNL